VSDSSTLNADIENIVKAMIVGRDVQDPVSTPGGETTSRAFTEAGALAPPYEPETLVRLFEYSNSLRPNVDAYSTNIDGFGHRLDPAIDLAAEDADERVADCIFVERVAELQNGVASGGVESLEPTPDEVAARRRELARLSRVEKARLETFFSSCAFDSSFVAMRRQTRQDLEITGNAYWEVLRNGRGEIARLVYVPAYTMRLLPLDPTPVAVKEAVRISPVAVEVVETRRRLRRFVQIQGGERTYFKAYGDPRTMSRLTGQVHAGEGIVTNGNEDDCPATEILHFAIPSSRSPYGVPRWIGALLSVLGSRSMEEVNLEYFEAKSVPPLALLVSGARLAEESIRRIERFLEENVKGKKNFHKILVIEAEGAGGDGTKTKVEFQPLTSAQQQDQLFSEYDKRNMDKVGGAFRLPRILRGESSELNRSLAEASLRLAEDQVFQPERDEFDHIVNHKLLGDMGIRFWRFKSQTPVTRDPERLTDMVEKLVRVGVLTPEEGRLLANDIFNREFAKLRAPWVKLPITLTLAGLQNDGTAAIRQPGSTPGGPPTESSPLVVQARRLLQLREELLKEEERLATERMALARRYATEGTPPSSREKSPA
jgi:PBSX family phage portal protein